MRRAVLMTRQAISPRLAIRIRLNIFLTAAFGRDPEPQTGTQGTGVTIPSYSKTKQRQRLICRKSACQGRYSCAAPSGLAAGAACLIRPDRLPLRRGPGKATFSESFFSKKDSTKWRSLRFLHSQTQTRKDSAINPNSYPGQPRRNLSVISWNCRYSHSSSAPTKENGGLLRSASATITPQRDFKKPSRFRHGLHRLSSPWKSSATCRPDPSGKFYVPSTMSAWALDGTATNHFSTRSSGCRWGLPASFGFAVPTATNGSVSRSPPNRVHST